MSFKEYLQEAKELTIDVDFGPMVDVTDKLLKDYSRKFKVKFSKPKGPTAGGPPVTSVDMTGKKENLIKFLNDEFGYDSSDIKEYYPELG